MLNYISNHEGGVDIRTLLTAVSRAYTQGAQIIQRAKILIDLFYCNNHSYVARKHNTSRKTVGKWNDRFLKFINESWSLNWDQRTKIKAIVSILSDAPRTGTVPKFDEKVACRVMALAVRDPEEFGRKITHWSLTELTDEVIEQQIVESIDRSTVGRILQNADIRPHKLKYWLNPKIECEKQHLLEIEEVCTTYKKLANDPSTIVYSTDEKTGIQALETINPVKKVRIGSPEKKEYEYTRHGTLCLIPSFNVATGCIDTYTISETRDENDFASHIRKTLEYASRKDKNIVWVMDQLNTHKSEALVRLFAEYNGITEDLGAKRKSGILESMKTRKAFLEDKSHRVRIVYTPKHCSWLNQVEIWFGILTRKLLKRLSCTSKAELRIHITEFIEYFNENLAKPYRWTYAGKGLKV